VRTGACQGPFRAHSTRYPGLVGDTCANLLWPDVEARHSTDAMSIPWYTEITSALGPMTAIQDINRRAEVSN
jgi:hypothetical protein